MEMQIFGAQLSRGNFVNEKTGENIPYDSVKFHVLATLTQPRPHYVGKEVGVIIGDGSLWEKRVQMMTGKFPGLFRLTFGQRLRNGKLETVIMDLEPVGKA